MTSDQSLLEMPSPSRETAPKTSASFSGLLISPNGLRVPLRSDTDRAQPTKHELPLFLEADYIRRCASSSGGMCRPPGRPVYETYIGGQKLRQRSDPVRRTAPMEPADRPRRRSANDCSTSVHLSDNVDLEPFGAQPDNSPRMPKIYSMYDRNTGLVDSSQSSQNTLWFEEHFRHVYGASLASPTHQCIGMSASSEIWGFVEDQSSNCSERGSRGPRRR